MTQAQFLRALRRKLRGVPEAERAQALRYYKTYLQDAGLASGDDVTTLVGTPEQAARGILADNRIRQDRAQAAPKQEERSGAGRVLLGIFTVPFALIAFAVLLAFGFSGAGLVLGGAAMAALAFFTGAVGQGLIVAGYGLLMISVGVLLVVAVVVLWSLVARGMSALLRGKGAEDA